jgi:hypothetical protein
MLLGVFRLLPKVPGCFRIDSLLRSIHLGSAGKVPKPAQEIGEDVLREGEVLICDEWSFRIEYVDETLLEGLLGTL